MLNVAMLFAIMMIPGAALLLMSLVVSVLEQKPHLSVNDFDGRDNTMIEVDI